MLRVIRPQLRPYTIAILTSAIAGLLTWRLEPVMRPSFFTLFYPAVMVSSLYGGLKPGLLSVVLSAFIAKYFFLPPVHSLAFTSANSLFRFSLLLLLALMISLVSTALRTTKQRIAASLLKLQNSEQKYRRIVETANEGIWWIDAQARTTYVNSRMAQILGYTPVEMLGRSAFEFIYETDRAEAERRFEQQKRSIGENLEFCLRCKDGSSIWIQSNSTPMLDDEGECVGVLSMVTDISDAYRQATQRKRTEEALREKEQWLKLAFETAKLGAWQLDLKTGVLSGSDQCKANVGLPRDEEFSLQNAVEAIHPDDRDRVQEATARAIANRTDYEADYRAIWPDGSIHWIVARGRAMYAPDGVPLRLVGVCLDITERKRAENALRTSENLYRTLSEAVPDFVWSCDDRGQLDFVNSRWLEYAGMTVEELNAEGVEQVYYPEDFPRVMQQWNLAIQNQEPFEVECRYRRKDGVYRWFMVRAVPLQDARGNIVKWIGTTTDIHERKQAEQALREQEERLSAALWASATGTYRWDIRTNVVDWDENLNRLFGLPQGATVRQIEEFVALIHPDDCEAVVAQVERCILSGVDFDMEFRVIWPDGSVHWLLDKGKTVFDEQGNPLYMTGACLDVTERKQTTEALSQSEERLRVALKNSPVSVFNQDRELRYLWKYNPMFDHDIKAVIGKRDIDLLPKDDAEILTRIKRQVLETGIGAREEIKMTLQGKDWYYDLTVEPLRDTKNEVIGVTCAAVNITEYKQTEIALRKSETVLNALLASSPIAVAFLDRDLRYIHANEALAAMNGLPLSEHRGRTLWDVLPRWAPQLAPILQQVMETQQPLLNQELSGETNPLGMQRHCLVNYYPVCLPDGEILGVGVSSLDVTELKQVELALRESESRFRLMADGAPMFIWMSGTDGHCTYFNQLWLEFVGQTLEEALTTGWPEGIHPDDKEYCLQTYISAFNARERFQVEYRHRRHDGEYRWLLDEGVPLFNGDGTFLGYIGSGMDISERKRTEQAQQYLAQASQVLSSSLDYQTTLASIAHLSVPHLADWCTVHLIEADDTVQSLATVHINPEKIAWAQQINEKYPFDPNELRGVANVLRTGQSELYPDIPDHLLVEAARDAEHLQILREVGFKSVMIVPMLVQGRTMGTISFIAAESGRRYDQTDLALAEELAHRAALAVENAGLYQQAQQARQKAEQAAERTARLQAITAAFSEALTPSQVAEVVVNQGITTLGITSGFVALLTDNDTSLEIVQSVGLPPEAIESWRRFPITASVPVAEIVRTGKPIFLENVEALATQYLILTQAPIMTSKSAFACIPVTVEGRTLGGMSFSFTEGTTFNQEDRAFMLTLGYLCGQAIVRARLYEAEQGARRDAEAANRIKDEFLAVLSHELRSPLNPILGWTKLLRSRKFDEKATDRALETIERNAKLQTQLIEDLLDVSRILRGKLALNIAPVNLVATIEAAMETVRLAAQAKAIQIETIFEPNVGQVSGDANRLQQVIWNLLSNAIKFTPQGGRVEVRLSTDCDGKDCNPNSKFQYAQIQVKDTGKGISRKFLPHVFEYFRQENSSTTRQFGGLGLGLAIVRYLTELHGGSVRADSLGEGLGATFTVRLPLMVAQEEAPEETMRSMSSVNLDGLHVLVVDDEADIRELVAFILEQSGAMVSVAASAEEALLVLEKSVPDILLSDIGMPNVDGYMLMQQVKELFARQGESVSEFSQAMPKAIALTAYAGEYNQQQALQAGFQLHIPKPVEPEELVNAIARLARFEFTDC